MITNFALAVIIMSKQGNIAIIVFSNFAENANGIDYRLLIFLNNEYFC